MSTIVRISSLIQRGTDGLVINKLRGVSGSIFKMYGARFNSDKAEFEQLSNNQGDLCDSSNKSGSKFGGVRLLSSSTKYPTNDESSRVPLIALQSPIFPKFNHWVSISNEILSQSVSDAYQKGPQLVACFAQREINDKSHVCDLNKVYHVGTLARITKYVSLTSKDTRMVVSGIRRVRFANKFLNEYNVEFHRKTPEYDKFPNYIHDNSTNFDQKNPSIKEILRRTSKKEIKIVKEAETLPVISQAWINDYNTYMNASDDALATVLANDIVNSLKEVIGLSNPPFTIQTELSINGKYTLEDYVAIADTVSFIRYRPHFLQDIIEEPDIVSRLERAHYMLKRELEITKISYDITRQTDENIYRVGRRNYLMEQLKAIQKELGITGDHGNFSGGDTFPPRKKHPSDKYYERMVNLEVPDHVRNVFNEELEKIRSMDVSHSEFQSLSNYLDAISSLPWGKYSSSTADLKAARAILDEDHYGISDVKDLIIEHLAVSNQSEKCRGKIMCLAGPPGVGKTSIVKSIARCLNKDYVRVSVGGMDDVAEIKGHRRTYLGSMPGRIIACLRKSKSMNPVILLDEIDKMSRTYKGDPSAALLEALDPEQNFNFLDHFLDFPVDLSKCLFIGTANDLNTIQKPLLDRMEVIEINSYINEEKYNIAKLHLIPDTINYFGITPNTISIDDDCLNVMINDYSREPGMRSLKKSIEKIYRKASTKLQQGEAPPIVVTPENLSKYIGAPLFYKEKYFEEAPTGVVPGLSYTGLGGRVLYIESICLPEPKVYQNSGAVANSDNSVTNNTILKPTEGIIITGHLGEVMKESCQIAKSVASSFLHKLEPHNNFFDVTRIHCHFPDGSPQKEGPSAGIAITTSFLSLAINTPVRKDLCMTGEICLSKCVLPIGGLAEKLLAAIRSGFKYVVIPQQNKRDIEELNETITSKLTFFYANTYEDVFKVAFPNYQPQTKDATDNIHDKSINRTPL